MRSNVKFYKQKRRYENKIKKIEKLHLETLEDWNRLHNNWFCENVNLQEELIKKEKEFSRYLIFGLIVFLLSVCLIKTT